jgi:hypothetical protein
MQKIKMRCIVWEILTLKQKKFREQRHIPFNLLRITLRRIPIITTINVNLLLRQRLLSMAKGSSTFISKDKNNVLQKFPMTLNAFQIGLSIMQIKKQTGCMFEKIG